MVELFAIVRMIGARILLYARGTPPKKCRLKDVVQGNLRNLRRRSAAASNVKYIRSGFVAEFLVMSPSPCKPLM